MGNPHDLNRLSYLAGFIDGDGCIQLKTFKTTNIKANKKYRYEAIIPSVELSNTNEAIIRYCQNILKDFGLKSNYCVNSKTGGRPYYRLILRSQNRCRKLLNIIIPYLIEKKEQAKVIVEFANWRNRSSRDYTSTDWDYIDKFRQAQEEQGQIPHNYYNGYLAGLLDSEGSISLIGGYPIKRNRIAPIHARIRFFNTNPILAEYVVEHFDIFGVKAHIYTKKVKSGKTFYEITAQGVLKCKKLLDKMHSYLIGTKAQSSIVLQYANHRLSLAEQEKPKRPYGSLDYSLLEACKAIDI